MAKSKTPKTTTAAAPKARKGKGREFPRIAEALAAPLATPKSEARSDAAVRRHAKAGHTSVKGEQPAKAKPDFVTCGPMVIEIAPPPAPEPTSGIEVASVKVGKTKLTKRGQEFTAGLAERKKVSALDAAARVLVEAGEPMTCQAMIDAMAAKGYWTSPGGKTPAATLYSAILREITTKAEASRFTKTERGKFASAGAK